MRLFLSLICVLAFAPGGAFADEKPKPFVGPAPQSVAPHVTPVFVPPNLPRLGTREVWQYYGVDRRGRWVPRVIMAPPTSYYYYNGRPFRYTTTQPSLVMPYVVD